ncbi:hypothetical protein THIBAULT_37 [Mycobacterium phage Thibault]|uniref:Uncharacterized protein n=1 Tax=Mycobacterium phage Thibault TaxID=1052673 RepID=G1FGA2_9CAUD|nr:hypothetical protein CL87_gp037 [Mycobacterium phage Thibault]AEJ93985.1 hypothetical protein THIBAULT_37 [Mycobacterium phage Thibault]
MSIRGKYTKGREAFARGEINWMGDDIRAALIDDADYTVNLASDEFLSDIPSGAIVATSPNFTGKSVTNGYLKAAKLIFPTVTGDIAEAAVIYKWTGTASTSRLIAYVSSELYTSVTPNGANIIINWPGIGILRI